MPSYRFTGESPVTVPDLKRMADDPVMPGEVVDTDLEINNAFFVPMDAATDAAPEAAEAPAEPEATEQAPQPSEEPAPAPSEPAESNQQEVPE